MERVVLMKIFPVRATEDFVFRKSAYFTNFSRGNPGLIMFNFVNM